MPPPTSAAERPSPTSTAASEAAEPTAGPYAAMCSRASLRGVAGHVSRCNLACLDRGSTKYQSALWQHPGHAWPPAAWPANRRQRVASPQRLQAGPPALCDLTSLQWAVRGVSQLCHLTCLHRGTFRHEMALWHHRARCPLQSQCQAVLVPREECHLQTDRHTPSRAILQTHRRRQLLVHHLVHTGRALKGRCCSKWRRHCRAQAALWGLSPDMRPLIRSAHLLGTVLLKRVMAPKLPRRPSAEGRRKGGDSATACLAAATRWPASCAPALRRGHQLRPERPWQLVEV